MNRRLVIMRHAHSSRDDPNLADHDRPLDERGLRDSPPVSYTHLTLPTNREV